MMNDVVVVGEGLEDGFEDPDIQEEFRYITWCFELAHYVALYGQSKVFEDLQNMADGLSKRRAAQVTMARVAGN